MQFFSKIALLAIAATGLVSAAPAPAPAELEARAMSGDLTYYTPGLGACGVYNSESDAIVAVSKTLFDPHTPGGNPNRNSLCGKKIKISRGGKSVTVTVRDRCEGCKTNDLDVPVKIFSKLANPSAGRVQMTWNWV
ncbi:RlpA-like double-psi beta-barrel-protein domain-containing protein-containing protein [Xylaria cf. heliscus]|nr:RlpA-like double-psi beta-barrel-protein domain-containing protein-containing protein [Xylaria cf. heliscus]